MRVNTYKGVDEDKVKSIPMDDFLKMTSSRNRRTFARLKNNPKLKSFMEKVKAVLLKNPKKVIKTHVRDAIIIPEWVGLKFGVHNGKDFKPVEITFDKVGRRLGDFSHTTSRVLHSGPGVGATRGSKFVPLK
ncbi:MAG: ribosomal protein S19 family protein [Candidatus Micrarchaeota archaeon]